MKLYVVKRGTWVSSAVDAVFTTEQAALDYIAAQPELEWTDVRVNPQPEVWTVYETATAALEAQAILDASYG